MLSISSLAYYHEIGTASQTYSFENMVIREERNVFEEETGTLSKMYNMT